MREFLKRVVRTNFGCVLALAAMGQTRQFQDPAPPVVQHVADQPAAQAEAHPGVRFHRKPKPLPAGAVTSDWPSFLGPSHNAVSPETKLAHAFPPEGPPLVWEMKKGTGYSSPAIAGDYLVFMHRVGDQEIVECLKPASGERYWLYSYPTDYEDRYGYNNGPRASPVIDGDRVYTLGAQGELICFQIATGKVRWRRNLLKDFKIRQDFFGVAGTPLIEGDMLIACVGAPGGPTVIGLDKLTGRMRWGAGDQWGAGYSSPIPATIHGVRRVFVFAGGESDPPTGGLIVLEPKSGAVDFTYPWRSKSFESVNASCPVVFGNNVFISASYRTGGVLLEIQPNFRPKAVWTTKDFGLHFNTPIYQNGRLFGFDGRNEPDASLAAIEVKTGQIAWRTSPEWPEKIGDRTQMLGTFRGNLLAVDGQFLALGELGHLLWMDLTPKGYKEVSRSWLFAARQSWSLPVLSRGLLYVVQHERDALKGTGPRLLCYDLRATN